MDAQSMSGKLRITATSDRPVFVGIGPSDKVSAYPAVSVMVLSQYVELGLAIRLLSESAEGVGYLLKDRIGDVADFLDSIRRVAAGGSAIDPQIVSTLLHRRRSGSRLSGSPRGSVRCSG